MAGFFSSSGRLRPDFFCFIALSVALLVPGAVASELPRIRLEIESQPITAEVAIDAASHANGLMFRESLPRNHGMLFLFAEPHQPCFWMKNTYVPLTIAFIDTEGVIVSLADMQPESLDTHCAIAPIRYALEMEQGWFARNGARPGTQVHGLPRLKHRAAPE